MVVVGDLGIAGHLGEVHAAHRGERRRHAPARHHRALAVDLELVEAAVVLGYPQGAVAVLRLEVALPQVGGLEDVAVGIDGAVVGQPMGVMQRLVHQGQPHSDPTPLSTSLPRWRADALTPGVRSLRHKCRVLRDSGPEWRRSERPPGTARGEETRRALLDAAERLFAENGYHATSVPDIVKAAGVGHGTFYEYFGSRHQILLALTQQALASQQRRPKLASQTLAERIRAEIFWYLSDHVEHLTLSKVWHEASSFDDEIATARRVERARRVARVRRGIEEAGPRPGIDPDVAATALNAMLEEFAYRWFVEGIGPAPARPTWSRRQRRSRRCGLLRSVWTRGGRAVSDPFEIVEVDVRGTPTRVFKNAPPSLRAVWLASVAHGDKTFLVYEDERYSFAEAHRIVNALAQRLGTYGVQPGDRVAIAMRNYPEWAFAFWAAHRGRRRRRAAQRVVDRSRARLRPDRLGQRRAVRRRGARRAARTAPRPDTACASVVLARTERYMPNARDVRRRARELDVARVARHRGRARRRRDDHVHVGHDGEAEGRGRDAPQLHGVPHEPHVPADDGGRRANAADAPPPTPRPAARRRCSRSRCSTSAGCSRSCWSTPRSAARSC